MSAEIELRKWLNRPDKNFQTNLKLAIKLWESIEFVLISKHEIITEEFCKNLKKFRKSCDTLDDYFEAWNLINEFLALKSSAGSVNPTVKALLIETLVSEYKKTRKAPNQLLFQGLQLTLTNTAMQNYYKSNPEIYFEFVGVNFKLFTKIMQNETDLWVDGQRRKIKEMFESIKLFLKQTPLIHNLKEPFCVHLYEPLSELVIILKGKQMDLCAELFVIIQDVFLNQLEQLKKYVNNPDQSENISTIFQTSTHSFLLLFESILHLHKNEGELIAFLVRYLFKHYFKERPEINAPEMLNSIAYILQLLNKHNSPLNFKIEPNLTTVQLIAVELEQLFEQHYEIYSLETMKMLCAALELYPMMWEGNIFQLISKCMFLRKDEATLAIYEQFLCLNLDIYRRLSWAQKFISQLVKEMYDRLTTVKLSKKMKRKSGISEVKLPSKKMKLNSLDSSTIEQQETDHNPLLTLLFESLVLSSASLPKAPSNHIDSIVTWHNIEFAWPSSVSATFITFISGLVSKPSLVVWKTLLFILLDYIEVLKNGQTDENTLFLIEYTSALLCQYFTGARLAEQSDKTWLLIEEHSLKTNSVLKDFGNAIISQEHNIRTMNAFLKICYSFANFELLLWYYCPDSMNSGANISSIDRYPELPAIDVQQKVTNLHSYLLPAEWNLIEQRITNFGRKECKTNMDKIFLQKIKASLLFGAHGANKSEEPIISNKQNFLYTSDPSHITEFFHDYSVRSLFIDQLHRTEKISICEKLISTNSLPTEFFQCLLENLEFYEIFVITMYKQLADQFSSSSKKSIFLQIDFEPILKGQWSGHLSKLNQVLSRYIDGDEIVMQKYAEEDSVLELLGMLQKLPVDFVSKEMKNVLFLLNIALMCDIKATKNDKLMDKGIQLMIQFLHFGPLPDIFKLITITQLSKIFICTELPECRKIYEIIFENCTTLKLDVEENSINLSILVKELKNYEDSSENSFDISLLLVEYLGKNRKCLEHYTTLRKSILKKINKYFVIISNDTDVQKEYVAKTLSGFKTIITSTLAREEFSDDLDDDLRRVFKIYLNLSIDCHNEHSIKLLRNAVNYKVQLKFEDDEINEILKKYWLKFVESLKSEEKMDETNAEALLKIILPQKKPEQLIDMLTVVDDDSDDNILVNFSLYQHKLFSCIGKCQLDKSKGNIFNAFFKQISFRVIQLIGSQSADIIRNIDTILTLIACQRILCSNVQITMSTELVDDILGFLTKLNIKKLMQQIDGNTFTFSQFVRLHKDMSDLCYALIQHRHFFIVDRISQFVAVFKDLAHSVCLYKSDRPNVDNLDVAEVTALSDLAHKLENIIKSLVKYAKDVKRVAPYLLLYIINLMLSEGKSTTLYPNIKNHIEAICFDLISVCDHRVESFIMRNCNEASKQIYEQAVKEFNKYHKFKGKV